MTAPAPASRARRPRRRGRMMFIPRRSTARVAPTMTPLNAVLIALDAAKRTGYATYIAGRLWDYGEVNARSPADRATVFSNAIGAAYIRSIPVGVVCEVPYGGYQSAALSLYATVTAWRETWCMTGQPVGQMIERTAGQWRRDFGWSMLPRAQVRRLESVLADQVIARDLGMRRIYKPTPGPDACAAICIGQTIVRSGELKQLLRCETITSAG